MSIRVVVKDTFFAEAFYREIISDAEALDRLAGRGGTTSSINDRWYAVGAPRPTHAIRVGTTPPADAIHCLHRHMCLSGMRVLEGQCPWCLKAFTSRGTHWAVCGRCNVLWRAKVIPAPPCTHNTNPNACDLCCGPEDHPRDVTVIECLPVPPIFTGNDVSVYIDA